jgi:hypothetical protein
MRFMAPFFVCAFAALLLAPRDAGAGRLDSTTWSLDGTDRMQLSGSKPAKTHVAGATFTVDGTSRFEAVYPGVDATGTLTDKPRRRFAGAADPATVDALRSNLVSYVMTRTGAGSVNVRSMKVTMSGQVSKDGQKLTLKFTARLNGSVVVRGHHFAGSATETGTFTGHPM